MSCEHDEQHHVPHLEAEHDGGCKRELDEGPEVGEGGPGQPRPPVRAPSHDVGHLRERGEPRRGVVGERRPGDAPPEHGHQQREERDVGEQRGEPDPRHHAHLALRLQELLRREVDGEREHLRDDAARERPRRAGDAFVLPQQPQHRRRVHVQRRQQRSRGGEHDPRPLHVHAQHRHLPRAVGLPAQGLQRAAHPEEEAEGEVGDDGQADGHRRQLAVADVAREDLRRRVGAVHAHDVEGDGRRDRPQPPRLLHEHRPRGARRMHRRRVACRADGGDQRAGLLLVVVVVVVVAHRYHHVGGGNAARMARAAPGVGAPGVGDSRARHHGRRRVPCVGGAAGLVLARRYHHVGGGRVCGAGGNATGCCWCGARGAAPVGGGAAATPARSRLPFLASLLFLDTH